MIFTILILLLFSFFLIIKNWKNKYSWMFSTMFFSLNILLFSMLLYIIKLSNYRSVISVENYIYIILSKLKFAFYDIGTLCNVGIGLFMFSMWLITSFTYKQKVSKNVLFTKAALTLIPLIVFFYISSYNFNRRFYLYLNTLNDNGEGNAFLLNLFNHLSIFNYLILAYYMVNLIIFLKNEYYLTQIELKKNQIIVIGFSVMIIFVFYIVLFILGPFKSLTMPNKMLLNFNEIYPLYNKYLYTFLPIGVLIIFNIMIYILIRFKILDGINIMRKKVILRNSKFLLKDLRPVFHSYKNSFLSIKILENDIENKNFDLENNIKNLKKINFLATEAIDATSRLLNMFNELSLNVKEIDLINCILEALNSVVEENDIYISNRITYDKLIIYADKYQITEMFKNLFINAIDAIHSAKREKGIIQLDAICEHDWICIYIRDNGCGIDRKNIKYIFNPLFSTKKTHTNWGIGLSYVYKVVTAHLGHISVKSEVDKQTEFQVLLPNMTYNAY